MKKIKFKKLLFVVVFAFIFTMLNISNVSAKAASGAKKTYLGDNEVTLSESDIAAADRRKYNACKAKLNELNDASSDWSVFGDRYALSMELVSGNRYKISMDSSTLAPDLQAAGVRSSIKFEVVGMSYLDYVTGIDTSYSKSQINITSNNKIVRVGHDVYVKRPSTRNENTKGFGLVEINLQPTDGYNDPALTDLCNYNVPNYKNGKTLKVRLKKPYFTISLLSEDAGSAQETKEEIPSDIVIDKTPLVVGKINCNFPADNFERAFCEDKKKATTVSSVSQTMTCDASKVVSGNESIPDDKYYVNKKYFFYEKNIKSDVLNYEYRYSDCNVDNTEEVSCTVNCQEVVTVEYGPPVAAVGGQCFGYKVKVTSRVACRPVSQVNPPREYNGYCTPTPSCASSTSKAEKLNGTHRRGGPDEEFDSCIKQCDGGKYTENCSVSCYKKVYLGELSKTRGTEINYSDNIDDTVVVEQIKNKKKKSTSKSSPSPYVGYFCNSSKQIFWYNGTASSETWKTKKITDFVAKPIKNRKTGHDDRDPRYYWDLSALAKRYGCYKNTGIPASCSCKEKCIWVGCEGNVYLNPSYPNKVKDAPSGVQFITGNGIEDYRNNVEKYMKVKNFCKSKSTCSTKTSQYTIRVDYMENVERSTTKSFNAEGSLVPKNKNETKAYTILKNGGCYKYVSSDADRDRWYLSEWTLPSTWISEKYGTYSNTKPAGKSIVKENQVCLPFNVKNVNTKWANYYYTKQIGGKPTDASKPTYSVYSDDFGSTCLKASSSEASTTCNWKVTDNMIKNYTPQYNITANAKDFGYFNWNLTIKCFYATNTNICNPDNIPNKNVSEKCIPNKHIVRTVNLQDLFPNTAGTELSDQEKTGRTPGFNWTRFAENKENNALYKSDPIEYIKSVQKMGYGVYSDEHLDYRVTLTPESIRSIKSTTSSDFNYASFNGDSTVINGNSVVNYKSKLLRTTLQGSTLIPNDSALACNNMHNYNSSRCD